MKRLIYIFSLLVACFACFVCLSSMKANAASSDSTFQVKLSDTPSGKILKTGSVVSGYSPYELVRLSMQADLTQGMSEYIEDVVLGDAFDAFLKDSNNDFWSAFYTITYGSTTSSSKVYSKIVMPQWGVFIGSSYSHTKGTSSGNWYDSGKLNSEKGKYLIFSLNDAVYSVDLSDKTVLGGADVYDNLVMLRKAWLESFLPYTICIYSPDAVSDVENGLDDLSITTGTSITSKDAFLEYIIHPVYGVIPVEGSFESPSAVYQTLATSYITAKSYKRLPTVLTDFYYPEGFNGSGSFYISPDYLFWMFNHGRQDEDNAFVKVEVSDNSLYPCAPFSSGLNAQASQPYCYMHTLVPVAYVSRWTPSNTYGVYSMINRVYSDISASVKDVTMGTSMLGYFGFEYANGCIGRATITYSKYRDIYANLSYLEIYEDTAYVATGGDNYVHWDGTKFSVQSSASEVTATIRPQMRSIVYISLQDGCFYRVDDEIVVSSKLNDVGSSWQAAKGWVLTEKDGKTQVKEKGLTLDDIRGSSYRIFDDQGKERSLDDLVDVYRKSGYLSWNTFRNYAKLNSTNANHALTGTDSGEMINEPFKADIVFSFEKLEKAECSFKFMKVQSNPNYRSYFAEYDSKYNTVVSQLSSGPQMGINTGAHEVVDLNKKIEDYANTIAYDTNKIFHPTDEVHLVAIPTGFYECVEVRDNEVTEADEQGHKEIAVTNTYIETGRKLNVDYSGPTSINMALEGQAFKYANENTAQAQGIFYNQFGKISASRNPEDNLLEHKILFFGNSSHPAIVLSNEYVEQSGLLTWLQTNDAVQFMTQYTPITGYSANTLYTRITTSGVNFGFGAKDETDVDRLLEIQDELETSKELSVNSTIFTFLAVIGLFLITYAACLVIAYYLDIFNTFASISILNIITFGGCQAVHSKQEVIDMGVTDPKQQRRYVTLSGILVRWAVCTLFGILLFSSSKVFIFVMSLYEKLIGLFGL